MLIPQAKVNCPCFRHQQVLMTNPFHDPVPIPFEEMFSLERSTLVPYGAYPEVRLRWC